MLEMYSLNVTVPQNSAIPLNNVSIAKGTTAIHSAPATIQFNKKGLYMVQFDCSATPATAGVVSVQLMKNGILASDSFIESTATTTGPVALSFSTLVQVKEDNNCSCSTSPTTIELVNTGEESTFSIVKLTITKIC